MGRWAKSKFIVAIPVIGFGLFSHLISMDGMLETGLLVTLLIWIAADDAERDDWGFLAT